MDLQNKFPFLAPPMVSEKEGGEEGKRQRMQTSGKEKIGDEERLVDERGDVREDVKTEECREQIRKRRNEITG